MLAIVRLSEEVPQTDLSWLLLVTFGFFLLMIVVGWLVSRNKPAALAVEAQAHEGHGHTGKTVDDLKSLEGIGPKVQRVLNEAGIHTFADLAKADAEKIQELLDGAGLQYMTPAGWIAQSKLAAAGDMDGLARLQDELKGGRMAK